MKRAIAPLLVVAAMLAGCSAPAKDVEYKSINDFASAYEKGLGDGMKCFHTSNGISNVWIFTTCGPKSIIMLFDSNDMRKEIKQKNPLRDGNKWVQGPN